MKSVRETADALSGFSAEKTAKLHPSFRIVILHKFCINKEEADINLSE